MHKKILATVTYGSRLNEFINGALQSSIDSNTELLVIANGVTPEYKLSLEKLSTSYNFTVIYLDENIGSAGGFYRLVDECKKLNFDHLIILDDDNKLVTISHENELPDASFALRQGRTYIEQALKGLDPSAYLAGANSFLGFDIKRILKKKFQKNKINIDDYKFPWAPYGGLILSKKVVDCGIMPQKDFFLYCDDTLYTNQIANRFGLYLNRNYKIIDVADSWNVSTNGNVISRILHSKERWRTYYSVRNQVHFDHNRYNNKFAYSLNIICFFCVFSLLAIFHSIVDKNKTPIVKLFLKAVKDGMTGSLGNKGFSL